MYYPYRVIGVYIHPFPCFAVDPPGHLKILNVAGNWEALSQRYVNELVKYNNGRVLLDIRGLHLTEAQFGHISPRERPDPLERVFEDVDRYVHLLPASV